MRAPGMADHAENTTAAMPAKCTACNGALDNPFFCGSCRTLHPADGMSCFELLGLPPKYDVDLGAARRQYLKLVRDIHPDRMAPGAANVQRLCLRANARINEAWDILRDPVMRAEYLLELSGGKSAVEDRQIPQDVLMDALETRELIDQAKADDDSTTLERLCERLQARYQASLAKIADATRRLPGAENDRDQLRGLLNTIRYHRKMLELAECSHNAQG